MIRTAAQATIQRTPRLAPCTTHSTPPGSTAAGDPVQLGFVGSRNRPGGNGTGITLCGAQLVAEGMGLKKSKQLLPRWLAALIVGIVRRQMYRALAGGRAGSAGRASPCAPSSRSSVTLGRRPTASAILVLGKL